MTSSGADPSRVVRVKDKTLHELAELKKNVSSNKKSGKISVQDVIMWLVEYYYETSGERRPMV